MGITLFSRILLACVVALLACCLLSSCATHPPTTAGYTAKRGMNTVGPKLKENRHF